MISITFYVDGVADKHTGGNSVTRSFTILISNVMPRLRMVNLLPLRHVDAGLTMERNDCVQKMELILKENGTNPVKRWKILIIVVAKGISLLQHQAFHANNPPVLVKKQYPKQHLPLPLCPPLPLPRPLPLHPFLQYHIPLKPLQSPLSLKPPPPLHPQLLPLPLCPPVPLHPLQRCPMPPKPP
jgi:hypothetical protein